MARSRNIKPGFFQNDKLAEIPPLGRLLFAGLWTIADRAGRLEDRPKRIKAAVLPYDECDVDALLNQLAERAFIQRYVVAGARLIQVLNFNKHQNPHCKEPASTIPAPDEHQTSTVQEQDKNRSSRADSLNLIPDSLNPSSDADASVVASKLPTCPQKEILSLYGEILPELPQPRVWEGARAKNLAARWKWALADLKTRGRPNGPVDGIDYFRRMFIHIGKSDFLKGRDGKWSASLDWIVEAKNFAKILQGNYDNREAA